MLVILKTLFQMFWMIVKIPVYVLLFYMACFVVACVIQGAAFMIQGKKLPHPDDVVRKKTKKHGLLRSLFIDVPIRYTADLFQREPGFFPYQGVIVFTGRQGNGKTISAVEFLRRIHNQYPRSKVITNCDVKGQDLALMNWQPLVNYKNGVYGVVAFIDEMQNWFSSNQSKNFPPEMLQVVTQNRKNRRVILGTSQVFTRLSKPLREQVSEIRECYTFFGCFTVVIRREPFLDTEGSVEKLKYRGMYWFVHDDELRGMYNTYKVIDSLAESGFQPKAADPVIKINQTIVQSKGKGRR